MDSRTLTIALATVAVAAAAIVNMMALYSRQTVHRVYAAGFVSSAIGFILLTFQGYVTPWISIVLANGLNALFLFCLVWGLRLAGGAVRPLPWRFAPYLFFWLAATIAAVFINDRYELRALTNSALSIVLSLEFLLAFLRGKESEGSELRPTVWLLCLSFALFHLLRVAMVLSMAMPGMSLMRGGPAISFFLIGYIFFLIWWAGTIMALEGSTLFRSLQNTNAALRELATTDELTGLNNRHLLAQKLREEGERARRYHDDLSLIMFDLDHFKRVNDTWGHETGDAVLVLTAEVTRGQLREPDNIFRWGGEEFIILAPHTSLAGAKILAEKLRRAIDETEYPRVGNLTASFGVTAWLATETQEEWFKRVDRALYRAKNEGRNRVVALEALDIPPLAQVRLEWRSEWESGNDQLDEQHRLLLEMSSALMDLSFSASPAEAIAPQLDRLLEHTIKHFADEEAILAKSGYPDAKAHAQVHRTLVKEALRLKTRFLDGELDSTELFDFLIGKVIIGHLQAADTKFFPWTSGAR